MKHILLLLFFFISACDFKSPSDNALLGGYPINFFDMNETQLKFFAFRVSKMSLRMKCGNEFKRTSHGIVQSAEVKAILAIVLSKLPIKVS